MILITSLLISALQIYAYRHINKGNTLKAKTLLLLLIILANLFLLPSFFYPNSEDYPIVDVKCGTPSIGIFLFFWIVGNAIALIIHFIDFIIVWRRKKRIF